ncbi:hypothetical protein QQ045_016092 [Rhodiola kirilowii]
MRSLSGIGLALSLVFGCLLLALIVELYYMLWWKKKRNVFQNQMQQVVDEQEEEDELSSGSSSAREFLYMFCCNKVSSLSSCAALNPQQICASVRIRETQQQLSSNSDMLLKSEDGFLCPPRFLFTIKEETIEDLELESSDDDDDDDDGGGDGSKFLKRRKGSTSLNELLLLSIESHTPYLTPLPSPPFITPPITPPTIHGFNPFLESSTDAEISKIKASPPPKFKFLQDAEDKFQKRKMMEEDGLSNKPPCVSHDSFITIVIGNHSNDKAQ